MEEHMQAVEGPDNTSYGWVIPDVLYTLPGLNEGGDKEQRSRKFTRQ